MRKTVFALTFLLFLGTLPQTTSQAQVVVKLGDLGIHAYAPIYMGAEKGYFKERGIDLKLERFDSGAKMMAPLSTGELQVGVGAAGPGLFNALARGLPLKIAAGFSRNLPKYANNVLMVRADLKEQVKRFADLKGKKLAINARGSVQEYMLGKMVETEGLSYKDLDIVFMPWPDMNPAFARKAIDAGALVEPFVTLYQDRGLAYVWKRAADVIGEIELSVLFFNKDWAEKNPKVARDFMVAYIRAARGFHEYLTKGKDKEEVVNILVKYTPVKTKALYDRMTNSYVDPNGFLNRESIKDQQDWWAKMGDVPKKVDLDQFIDESYLKYALEQLGPLPR